MSSRPSVDVGVHVRGWLGYLAASCPVTTGINTRRRVICSQRSVLKPPGVKVSRRWTKHGQGLSVKEEEAVHFQLEMILVHDTWKRW